MPLKSFESISQNNSSERRQTKCKSTQPLFLRMAEDSKCIRDSADRKFEENILQKSIPG
jgi:hypothetical protein